jgi:integrase
MAATALRLPRYLVLQHQTYWARIRVPRDVRSAFDTDEYWENLGKDRKVAEAHCHRVAATFWSRVAEARGRAGAVEHDALAWRRRIASADADEAASVRETHGPDGQYSHTYEGVVVDAAVMAAADRYVPGGRAVVIRRANLLHEGNEVAALKELGGPKAENFLAIALEGRKPLQPFVEPWYKVRFGEVEAKTAAMDKSAANRFAEAFPLASDVTKRAVADWIEKRKLTVAAATVQREVTGLRSFWSYLKTQQEVPDDIDPFAGQKFQDRRKAIQRLKRVDFAASEVAALYGAALKIKDQQLADLIALAAYTGARREELCSLKIEGVTKGWINVTDAKTASGWRDVPIHRSAAPIFKRLIGKRTTGYVLADTGKDRWGNRGDAPGKRFTRLKGPKTKATPNGMGFGSDKTFHSIRHSFGTILRSNGVEEPVVSALMGHKLSSETFGRYGKRGGRELLPAALKKLKYPKPL